MQLTALLLLAALASAPEEGTAKADEAPKRFTWVVPKALETLSIPGESWAHGIPVRMHAVRSGEHPANILRDFVLAARKQGLYFPPREALPTPVVESTLTVLDPRARLSYTVILQPEPDGTCAVILSEADLGRRQKGPEKYFAPLPPGATNPLTTRMEGFETLSFDVGPGGSDPLAFFRTELPRAGFVEVEPLIFRKADVELALRILTPREGRKQTGVVIIRRSAAPATADQLFGSHDSQRPR